MRTFTFICGCGHSGTSLLANMFAAHPAVHVPLYETAAFLSPGRIQSRWSSVLQAAEDSGKPHLVEKTPRHIRCMDRIRQHVESPRFVLMVRDGRDVVASFRKRYGEIETGMRRWLEENRIVVAELGSPDTMLLRYEDLVADAEGSLRRCCAFAGIPFDASMLRFHESTRLWFGESEVREGSGTNGAEHVALRNWQINQPLFDGRGRWRQSLTDEDLRALPRDEFGALFERLGYAW